MSLDFNFSLSNDRPGPGWFIRGLYWVNPSTGEKRLRDLGFDGKPADELVAEMGEPSLADTTIAPIVKSGEQIVGALARGTGDAVDFLRKGAEFADKISPIQVTSDFLSGMATGRNAREDRHAVARRGVEAFQGLMDRAPDHEPIAGPQEHALRGIRSLPTAAAAGAAYAANPALGTGLMFAGEAGEASDRAREILGEDGELSMLDEVQSMAIGGGVGAASAALERTGLDWLFGKVSKPARELLSRRGKGSSAASEAEITQILGVLGVEPGTEGLQTIVQAAGEVAAGRDIGDVANDLPGRLKESIISAYVTGPLLTAGRNMSSNNEQKIQDALAPHVPEIWNDKIESFKAKYEAEPDSPNIAEPTFWSKFYHEVFNREQAPVRYMKKKVGKEDAEFLDMLFERHRGVASVADGYIFGDVKRLDPETGNMQVMGEGLAGIFSELPKDAMADLRVFMKAERELELREREDFDTSDEAVTDSREVIEALNQKYANGEMDHYAGRVRQWMTRSILDPLFDVGFISLEDRTHMLAENQKYVPFWRVVEQFENTVPDELSKGARGPKLKKITGDLSGGKTSPYTFEELIVKVQGISRFVERQRILNHVASFADPESPNYNEAYAEEVIQGEMVNSKIGPVPPEGSFLQYVDGKATPYHAPADMMKSLDSLTPKQSHWIMSALKYPVQMLRAGATLSPEFVVRNFFRDQQTAAIYSKWGYVPMVDAWKGFLEIAGVGDRGQYFQDFIDSGAAYSVFVALDQDTPKAILDDVLSQRDDGKNVFRRFGSQVKRGVREAATAKGRVSNPTLNKLLGTIAAGPVGVKVGLQEFSGLVESVTRVGAYKRAKEKGASDLEAMSEARGITLDFGRAGDLGRTFNGLQTFFNAEMQDPDKFARAVKASPLKTMTKVFSYITLPSIANWVANYGDPDYEEIEDWRKLTHYHIKVAGTPLEDEASSPYIEIPRLIGFMNVSFGYSVERFLDYLMETGKDPKAHLKLKEKIEEAFNEQTPVGRVNIGMPPNIPDIADATSRWMPTAQVPWTEAAANRDLTFQEGTPIESQGDQRYRVMRDRYSEWTPSVYKAGADMGIGSPKMIQHVTEGMLATLGRMGMQGASHVLEDVGLADPTQRLPESMSTTPAVRVFYGRKPIGYSSQSYKDFYKFASQVEQQAGSLQFRITNGEITPNSLAKLRDGLIGINEFLPADLKDAVHIDEIKEAKSTISDLKKMRTHFAGQSNWGKVEEIDRAITRVAREALERTGRLIPVDEKAESKRRVIDKLFSRMRKEKG